MHATPDAPPTALSEEAVADHLAPLIFFYGLGSARPKATFIDSVQLPDQERWLLCHDGDMTSRLREHHHSEIDLDVHAKQKLGDYYVRASVLTRRSDGIPVEFGAIGIHLDTLPDAARQLVADGRIPLGGVLERERVSFTSHPSGFFRISIDARLAELLGATSGQVLYGRCNTLRAGDGRVMAEVVEVLPRGDASGAGGK